MKYASDGEDTIHLAFTEGHPETHVNGIAYAALRGGRFYAADGRQLGDLSKPLRPEEADRVYEPATAGNAWVHDLAVDAAGRPAIVYATLPSLTDHRYRYARWTGTAWRDAELTPAGPAFATGPGEPEYSGGIALDHDDPSTVFLSREVDGAHELERWRTPDGGETWSRAAVTVRSGQDNARPVVPRGRRGGEPEVVWMRGAYVDYTDYHTAVAGLFADRPAPPPAPSPTGPGGESRPPRRAVSLGIRVSTRARRRVRIVGNLRERGSRAPLAGAAVELLVRRGGRWRRVATARTARGGVVGFARRRGPSPRVRLRFPGSGTHRAALSRVRRVPAVR